VRLITKRVNVFSKQKANQFNEAIKNQRLAKKSPALDVAKPATHCPPADTKRPLDYGDSW